MNTLNKILQLAITDKRWFFAKVCFIVIFTTTLIIFALPLSNCLYPSGICRLISFELLFSSAGKLALIGFLILVSFFYLFEFKMLFTTFSLFLISLIVISFQESNGIFSRATILTVIPGVQFIAYIIHNFNSRFNLKYYRYQFSVQMVVAGYVLAGISKYYVSGLNWFLNTEGFVIQIYKNFYFLYSDTGNVAYIEKANAIADLFFKYPVFPQFLLFGALVLELFCFVVLICPKIKLAWGFGLLLMHIGIAYNMGIGISVIAFPMVIYFINPLWEVYRIGEKLFFRSSDNA